MLAAHHGFAQVAGDEQRLLRSAAQERHADRPARSRPNVQHQATAVQRRVHHLAPGSIGSVPAFRILVIILVDGLILGRPLLAPQSAIALGTFHHDDRYLVTQVEAPTTLATGERPSADAAVARLAFKL